MAHPELHYRIDVFCLAEILLECEDGFIDHGAQDPIRDEAGRVFGLNRFFPHSAANLDCQGESRLRGVQPADDFKQAHQRDRVEEVHPDHPVRPSRGGPDAGDRDGRGIGGQDRFGSCAPVELFKDAELGFRILSCGFNDQVNLSRGPEIGRSGDTAGGQQLLGREDTFADQLGCRFLDRSQATLERGRIDVGQNHLIARDRGSLGDSVAHSAGSDDEDLLSLHGSLQLDCHGDRLSATQAE